MQLLKHMEMLLINSLVDMQYRERCEGFAGQLKECINKQEAQLPQKERASAVITHFKLIRNH